MSPKTKKVAIAAAVVVGIGGLAGVSLASGGEKGVQVRTELVEARDLVSTVTASGKIEPKRKVDISADISGRAVEVAVEEGQWVERGDLLIRIDPTAYQAAVLRAEASVAQSRAREAQARAQLLQSRNALQRAESLSQGQNLISAADLEQARTAAQVAEAEHQAARYGVTQAQAALSEARNALSKTTIVAPMSGRVTRLNIQEGETAIVGTMNNPGSLLLTIADLSVMQATVRVDETDVPAITLGDSVTVRVDAFAGRLFPGTVTRIGNSSIQTPGAGMDQSVDYEVVVTLENPPAELRPDLSATAEIVTAVRPDALAVPIIALTVRDTAGKKLRTTDDDGPAGRRNNGRPERQNEVEGVFVLRDGKAAWMPVEIGIAGDRYFEVVRGLSGGETVVSGTFQVIRDLEAGRALRTGDGKRRGARGGGDTAQGGAEG
jgi:HlyD family secretion protein